MAILYSNELKAVVIAENFIENPLNVLKENCLTVQNFDYRCVRKRNKSGEQYGSMEPVMLTFSVRVNSMNQARVFYRNLAAVGYFQYSFLFNPTFNPMMRLNNYDDGMVVEGYVVGVEENYTTERNQAGESQQVMLNVKILVRSVVYLGHEDSNNIKSVFIQ